MELSTGALSWWKCHWADLKSAGLSWRNLFLNSLKTIVTLTLTLRPIKSGVLTSLLLPYPSSSLTDSLPSLNLLCHSKTDARWLKSSLKHSIRFCGIFSILKQNFIAYRSSKVSSRPDYIFEIHQPWQSDCSCSFEAEIIKIGQSSCYILT